MIAPLGDVWLYASGAGYFLGTLLSVGAVLYAAQTGDAARHDRRAMLSACGAVALWCLCALFWPGEMVVALALMVRNIALLGLVFRLFAVDGRHESLKPARPLVGALIFVQLCHPVLLAFRDLQTINTMVASTIFEIAILLDALVAIGALMLLHNLYGGAAASARATIRLAAVGLAGLFAYQLNAATIGWLIGEPLPILTAAHGLFAGAMTAIIVLGSKRSTSELQFRPSRAVTFQTLSLLVIGSYVALMVVATRSLALLGGDIARGSQVLLLIAAILATLAWLPSRRLRDRLRMFAAKHLFSHRYDYRDEWLRFTRTIGRGSSHDAHFHERAIKAVADITDSPAGLLLVPDEQAQIALSARWNWQTFEVPTIAAAQELAHVLEAQDRILDLDEMRHTTKHSDRYAQVPSWLAEADDAWALVPLIHFDRLVGLIVLARPRIERRLDWEDFDLLRVVGRQLASYLAEQTGQEALMDANRFEEFNRRMAFVMHDIKNLASQLSLLSANAQKHADNPEFRADMLVTLRNASDKLLSLLTRLGHYGQPEQPALQKVSLSALASSVAERFRPVHPVMTASEPCVEVQADADGLEQALVHLVQNAIDASPANEPVFLNVHTQGLNGAIEIIDAGCGMSAQFLRTGLFKPFVSSKQGGFGIGAFEAREMVRAMAGRLTVESREGIGTRFCISLPRLEAARVSVGNTYYAKERAA